MLFENELDNEADPVDDNLPESQEDIGGDIENEDSPDISQHEEAVARARGWVPKDQYRGKPEDWQDANSFLDRNSSLKKDVETLQERLARQEEEYQERLRRIERTSERIIQNDRERLITELETAKRQAAELGDMEAYDKAREQESEYYRRIAQEAREAEQEHTSRQRQPANQPEIWEETQAWIRQNSWFNESPSMRQIALGFYEEALEGMPGRKDEQRRLAFVEKQMARVYPQKFGERSSSAVEGGRRPMMASAPKLSADEEAACKRFIAKGLIKDRAEYIKYLNDD